MTGKCKDHGKAKEQKLPEEGAFELRSEAQQRLASEGEVGEGSSEQGATLFDWDTVQSGRITELWPS